MRLKITLKQKHQNKLGTSMKLRKLNTSGVAHHFLLALIVVGIITAFTFQAVAGHALVTSNTQPNPCAKGYALRNQVCVTTVKPACPTGTTLKTGVDSTSKVTFYYCVNTAGLNISAGSEGIAPPAATVLVSCYVDAQKHVQKLTQAACTAIQAKNHITKLGQLIVQCNYTLQTGVTVVSTHTEPYCNSVKTQAANRLNALMNACEAQKNNLSISTVKPSYACVLDVQTRLKAAGIAVNVDGKMTSATDSAIRAFQTKHSPLVVDGIVGSCTWPTLITGRVPSYCIPTKHATNSSSSSSSSNSNAASHTTTSTTTATSTGSQVGNCTFQLRVEGSGYITTTVKMTRAKCATELSSSFKETTAVTATTKSAPKPTTPKTKNYSYYTSRGTHVCAFLTSVDHTGKARLSILGDSLSEATCAHMANEVDCRYIVANNDDSLGKVTFKWRTPGTGSGNCATLQATAPFLGTCTYYPFVGKSGYSDTASLVTSTQKWCLHRDNGPGNKIRSWVALKPAKRAS
jgi:peptidoglycan hydrolase-like protein with peptidoglycan-binding domain